MAGRFLIQKFSSQICKSRSLLSVAARAGAPVPLIQEGSISTLGKLSHGATAHQVPLVHHNAVIHGSAARYFNTFQRSCASAKTNCSTTSMPSIIINHLKPACVDSSGGAKASFSSTRHKISRKAKSAAWQAEWDAKSAAWQAQNAAWEAEMETRTSDFSKFIRNQAWLWGFSGSYWTYVTFFPGDSGTSFCNGQRCGVSKS